MSENCQAFISVRDTKGLLELAGHLTAAGYALTCSVETASFLGQNGVEVAQLVSEVDMPQFDLVVCDLFDFQNLMNQEGGLTEEEARAKMDLEHQAIILVAAANYHQTAIICEGSDYRRLKEHLKHLGETTPTFRKYLAAKAFRKVAEHNFAISAYLNLTGANVGQQETLPL